MGEERSSNVNAKDTSMKIVIYTAIFGEIDRLWSVMPDSSDVQHVIFTNKKRSEYGLWEGNPPRIIFNTRTIKVPPIWEQCIVKPRWNNRRTARHYKVLPHRYLPDADVWIWIDGNIRLQMHPTDIIKRFLRGDLMTFNHPYRNCLYVEADLCAKHHKDIPATLNTQTAKYRAKGMPRRWGLAETRCVIRRNTPAIREFNEAWWTEIEHGSLRDQVSFPFVCWSKGIRWIPIPGHCGPGKPKEPFQFLKHNT